MSSSQIQVAGEQVDILDGGDVDPMGQLLSVAEIQHALRELRQRRGSVSPSRRSAATSGIADVAPRPRPSAPDTAQRRRTAAPDIASTAQIAPLDPPPDTMHPRFEKAIPAPRCGPDTGETAPPRRRPGSLDSDWIAVVAAHAGAGPSCVALALVDALSAAQRPARLVETAAPSRSGLVAAASAELGTDPSGAWRRGSRQLATILRRTSGDPPGGWPDHGAEGRGATTVVDLGLPAVENLAALAGDQPGIVVVCRVTVPAVRMTEQMLTHLHGSFVVVAAIGPRRWPGPILAGLGPQLRFARDSGRVVTVPDDRHLQLGGATTAPLPKPVAAAGRALLGLIDATRHSSAAAPRGKGTDTCQPR